MDNWTFGITVTVVGMGGTLLTLWLVSLLTTLLKKLFPLPTPPSPLKTRKREA
jgi:hypothetical protein